MDKEIINSLSDASIAFLKKLVAIPSFSMQEEGTADLLEDYLIYNGVSAQRWKNNVYAFNQYYDPAKPTVLLNSHHDTVKPNKSYSRDPFLAEVIDDKLYGLGSNDAGGSLVSLMAVFMHFHNNSNLKYNLAFAATAEEEISGANGIEGLLPELPVLDCAIVGEPTGMKMAVAEKGLMVLNGIAKGIAGHAAREEGVNAIYIAAADTIWFRDYRFDRVSDLLGPVKMSVTSIETTNKAHNVVPDECTFVVDIRLNELYSHQEVLDIIRSNVKTEVSPRSTRLKSSSIPLEHPLVKAGEGIGLEKFGSSTLSDCALLNIPALKLGPGQSERSHTADEYIYLDEIRKGISIYIDLLNQLL